MTDITNIAFITVSIFLMLIAGYSIMDLRGARAFWLMVVALMIWQVVF